MSYIPPTAQTEFTDISANGKFYTAIQEVNSDTFLGNGHKVLVDATGGDITLTLPNLSAGEAGREFHVKKIAGPNSAVLTISGWGPQTVDDQDFVEIKTVKQSFFVTSDGTQWHII